MGTISICAGGTRTKIGDQSFWSKDREETKLSLKTSQDTMRTYIIFRKNYFFRRINSLLPVIHFEYA